LGDARSVAWITGSAALTGRSGNIGTSIVRSARLAVAPTRQAFRGDGGGSMRGYLSSGGTSRRYTLMRGSCHDANNAPHTAQLAWLGDAGADVDSATRYDDPQDGQTASDIFMKQANAFRMIHGLS